MSGVEQFVRQGYSTKASRIRCPRSFKIALLAPFGRTLAVPLGDK